MSPETEKELMNYLAQGKTERVSMFDQLKGLGNASQRILHQLELHQQKDDAAFESLRYDIKGISARVADLERDVDSTGNYNMQELKGQLEERKRQEHGLKQIMLNAGVGALITFVGALLALLATYVLRKP